MAFQKHTDSFLSSDSKTAVACYFYEPVDREPIAVLQISHGMCEYLERYEDFAAFLCAKGIAVCGHDHLGHGRTAPNDGELGFIAEKNGAELLPEDLHKMTILAKRQYPNLPYFLLGHSMGSFIARKYLVKYGKELTGAVICGTSGGNPGAGMGIRLSGLACKLKGDHHRVKMLNNMAFGSYNKRFAPRKSDHDWLSRDVDLVSRYDADPWCNFIFTAAGFRDLFTLVRDVSAKEWAESVPKALPLLLIAGEDDPVGDYGKGVRKVACRLENAGVYDLSCRIYPKGRHEILNELERNVVYQDVWRWIRAKIV